MPDNNEVLAQELSDESLRALKANKTRRKVVQLMRRNEPLVESQSRQETLHQVVNEWLFKDELFVLNTLKFKLRLPNGARILDELLDLVVTSEAERRFVIKVQKTVHELAVRFIVK